MCIIYTRQSLTEFFHHRGTIISIKAVGMVANPPQEAMITTLLGSCYKKKIRINNDVETY